MALLGKKIVVVMSAYNAEKTLKQTMDEMPMDIVDHVILVDDCSRDNTVEHAQELGLEAIRHLKAEEGTKDIPIIALTAQTMVHDKQRIEEAGCDDMQAKPIEFATLLGAISKLLGS